MRKAGWVVVVGSLAVVAINAAVGTMRSCNCDPGCWCRRPGVRHLRWWIPFGHKNPA